MNVLKIEKYLQASRDSLFQIYQVDTVGERFVTKTRIRPDFFY